LLPAGNVAAAPLPMPEPEVLAQAGEEEETTVSADAAAPVATPLGTVPDFRGLTLKEALEALKKSQLALEPEVLGNGKIVSQEPAPGTKSARAHKLKWVLASHRAAPRERPRRSEYVQPGENRAAR
jgi:hypothetical protein